MRNLTLSEQATFASAQRWAKSNLPISLPWRNSLWRVNAPVLWLGLLVFWLWLVSLETPRVGLVFYGLVFVGVLLVLALVAFWWITQLVDRRITGNLVIDDSSLEWQYAASPDVDYLIDCSRFELAGKRDSDARIEWNLTSPPDAFAAASGPLLPLLRSIKPDRALYGRDVGLDRDDLEALCRLLNQLRDEAAAGR
jgi:hypothetical protein